MSDPGPGLAQIGTIGRDLLRRIARRDG
jgi:hypothetical protein